MRHPLRRITHDTLDIAALGKPQGHKYNHGHALIVSGGIGRGGAARMAARAALRIGAGAVTLACPPATLIENAAQLDAVMLRALKEPEALALILEDDRLNAICIGPGLGTGARAVELVAQALRAGHRRLVLDADALTILAGEPELFKVLHAGCILTPHAGEFQRLFPDLADRLAVEPPTGASVPKITATRDAANRAGCLVLFKGADTVIADASGAVSLHSASGARAVPWLATAGAGDVLAGFVTGLLARGFTPMQAVEFGVWLHVECALSFGPGLIAEDLPEELPKLLRHLRI